MSYQPNKLEEKWIAVWEKEGVYKTPQLTDKKKKQYILAMFPYPSGDGLHVGHTRIYTGTDVMARYFRMKGYQVLHPMGWDAFGLPAENRAIKEKKNPMDLVPKNIANFKRQMKRLGFSYDWEKEFSTTDPSYYQWTQWLFIQFFKMGLLEKREMPVYYCPSCKTGLAEEEVLPDGTHERCQKPITRKTLPQWVFKITRYADRLLADLEGLDWPEGILEMQRNWIGKSEGAEIEFSIFNLKIAKKIKVFTTRPDTLFGVTALVVAPEHWIIEEVLKIKNERLKIIKKYVDEAKRKLDLARTDLTKEKTGVFTGLYAIHPLTKEKIPIWVADYVLGWYGEGAVMVVPAHDERDFQFAKKFNLPIKKVIIESSKQKQDDKSKTTKDKKIEKAFTDYGVLVNSGEFDGLSSQEAIKKITEKLEKLGLGKKAVTYKLRDWIFSRQRYWGEPIPLVYCENCSQNSFKKKVALFIDDGNLFYGYKNSGWRVDLNRLKDYLRKEFGELIFVKYFISLPDKKDKAYEKSKRYIEKIKGIVEVVTKPLKYIKLGKKIIKKGNVDIELAISALTSASQYDIAVILSGDSDFVALRDKLLALKKKVIFLSYKSNLSWELKKGKYFILDQIRKDLEFNDKKTPTLNRGLLLKLLYKKKNELSSGKLGWVPLKEEDLPLKLPYLKSYEPTATGESPLSRVKEWVNTICPVCGGPAKRETDTMPNWAGSCWYFIAFTFWGKEARHRDFSSASPPQSGGSPKPLTQNQVAAPILLKKWQLYMENSRQWLPVDWYLGGAEHAVLHLLYARFWVKALNDLGLLSFKEPFLRLRNVGMVLAEDNRKMSKSFGNVINPDEVIEEYGADALRVYEMFMAPFNQEIAWSTKALQGAYRFLKRVKEIYEKESQNLDPKSQNQSLNLKSDKELKIKLQKTIKKVTEDIEATKFNTAIAAMMEFLNSWEKSRQSQNSNPITQNQNLKSKINRSLSAEDAKKFLQILAPFAPFLTEEIWREVFKEKTSIHLSKWPMVEEEIKEEEVILPIQINGKMRATIKVRREKLKTKQEIERLVLENEKIKKYLAGRKYKMIYIEGKIVNFVYGE